MSTSGSVPVPHGGWQAALTAAADAASRRTDPTPATAPPSTAGPGGWRDELAAAIRDPDELVRELALDPGSAAAVRRSVGGFPLLVPRSFVARMHRGDPHDPLLRQVLPVALEELPADGFDDDPLAEAAAIAAPALVRKYAGRCLLLLTGGCAVHCRYCFRRAFPYAAHGVNAAGVEAALAEIAGDTSLAEVILSGGDPLLLDDARLAEIVARLAGIPHVRRLRIHTRLPIVLPARVTSGLTRLLATSGLTCVVVVHANHAAELDDDVAAAIRRLAAAPAIMLNQTVLLAGINDEAGALAALSERLVEIGVVPYYLHLLDRVTGTAHFEVSESRAATLLARLREMLPGYAVPRLAREVPGEPAKVWLG